MSMFPHFVDIGSEMAVGWLTIRAGRAFFQKDYWYSFLL
jgi:hypothetical protein